MTIEGVKADCELLRNLNDEMLDIVRTYPLSKRKEKISELTKLIRSIEDKYRKFIEAIGVSSECHYEYGTIYQLSDILLFVNSLECENK